MTNSTSEITYYWQSLDFERLCKDFPPPPSFFDSVYRMSRENLDGLRNRRFLQQIERAWQIPFFQRHWRSAGLQPGDIRGLADLHVLPPYNVEDIRDSIDRAPPFGDFIGVSPQDSPRMPLVLQTSGGTTGMPRPMFYTPMDREAMAIMAGRRLAMNGVRPGDLVQVTLSLGLSNGGMAQREAIWRYSGAVPVMTGSGVSTPTRRQIEIAKTWGTKGLLGFPAYLRHMAIVARDELNIDPRELGMRMIGTHLGTEDRGTIEDLWGAPCFDSYGTHEAGLVATECSEKSGMHIHEDMVIIEIINPETGKPAVDGERGSVHITSLYKYAAPLIRFNVNDISAFAVDACPCGSTFRRLQKIYGRGDNMIKLRGLNVFPEAIGEIVAKDDRSTGEYFCIVETVGEARTDQMTILVETVDECVDGGTLKQELEARLKESLGVKMVVQTTKRGDLDQYTGVTRTSKIKRVLDRRC